MMVSLITWFILHLSHDIARVPMNGLESEIFLLTIAGARDFDV